MEILLFSVLALSVFGNRLSEEENGELQKMCGQTFLVNGLQGSILESMNTNISSRNEAPFAVQLRSTLQDGSAKERLRNSQPDCSGTIISPRHILTAAHCFANEGYRKCNGASIEEFTPTLMMSNILMKLNYFIIAAPTVCNATTCSSDLKRGIAKPKRVFVSRAWLNHFCSKTIKGEIRGDVAIVELEEDIAFGPTVQPACLNPSVGYRKLLTLYAYGTVEYDKTNTAGVLRKHESKTITQTMCRQYKVPDEFENPVTSADTALDLFPNGTFRIMADDICSISKKTMACQGDSGGGLVFKKLHRTYVAAVTSFGPPCVKHWKYPNGFMDVSASISPHLGWIWAATGITFGRNYAEEDIDVFMKDAYTFERHSNFDLELVRPHSFGQTLIQRRRYLP